MTVKSVFGIFEKESFQYVKIPLEFSLEVKTSQLLIALSQAFDLGEAKDLGHAQRVFLMVHAIARHKHAMPIDRMAPLAVASLCHDMAMVFVRDSLYQEIGDREAKVLRHYPSLGFEKEQEELSKLLLQHEEMGSQILKELGYDHLATRAVERHHSFREDGSLSHLIALAEWIDTSVCEWNRAEESRAKALEILDQRKGEISSDLVDAARRAFKSHALWEELIFLDSVETLLDQLFEHTYGLTMAFDGLEAHLRTLAQIIDAKSPFYAGHTLDVTWLAKRIGEHLNLDAALLEALYLGGLIHGVGRLGIPNALLEKPRKLSEEEWMQLQTYPTLSREVFRGVEGLWFIVDQACTYREKLDGSGYPEGLMGEEIPLIGRILAVADVFHALISDRPYRSGYPHDKALQILVSQKSSFDARVLRALEDVYREGF